MEVHHHPELPHGEKKRFKEYLLEFLMIVLAVTMGFIAENIREHFSASSKQDEYITRDRLKYSTHLIAYLKKEYDVE